ncbi:MAG: DUF4194 domain-containing protein [Phycisphaeraceae bacterium]|nr:DUF4194 domain-containing protein [Phycisphaerales bacterium]QOJ16362.1 MAG: DUF4194 domain-containing protein [Phycisphaeraceae bacterium]
MPNPSPSPIPEFREWSIAAVRLLQGVIYADEDRVWNILLSSRSQIETFVARLGLTLVVDEAEGYAYVRQWGEDECPSGYEQLPKLVRRSQLGYAPTMLAVLFRDELRRFEEDDLHNERCVVEIEAIFDQWKAFFPAQYDEVRHRKDFSAALHKLDDLGFVRKFADNPEAWEVRRILKAKLPASELEALKQQLAAAAAARTQGDSDA